MDIVLNSFLRESINDNMFVTMKTQMELYKFESGLIAIINSKNKFLFLLKTMCGFFIQYFCN